MPAPQTEITIHLDGTELARVVVEPGGYVIGADPASDIVARAEGISSRHARLTVTAGEMRIEDLGSDNGTFVAGALANGSVRIWHHQKVLLGPAVLEARRLRQSSAEQSLPAPAVAVRRLLPEEFRRDRKYEIGGTIGEGGMGAVLRAYEATTRRTVAMKVMLSGISQQDVTRFIAEAQITSQLEHPNIVPVHELGVDEHEQVFYTMKLVQGVTLRAVLEGLRNGDPETCAAYPLRRLLVVLLRVCEAVAFAHSRGVLHRDLKPDNVMIGDFGEVLVMDWGLAKILGAPDSEGPGSPFTEDTPAAEVRTVRLGDSDSLTIAGALVGTPHYMSPEQARGEVDTLDVRTDVWSLGAMLRHLLALAKPVPGATTDEILANVISGELQPIPAEARHCPAGRVPEALVAVASRAQALRREDRYPSVVAFRGEIDAYLGGFATSAEHAGALRQLWLLVLRHRAVAASLLALLILSVVFVVRLMASEHRAAASAQTAHTNELAAQQNERVAKAAEAAAKTEKEAARRAAARSQISLADAAYRVSDGRSMLSALELVPGDLRDSDWRYLRAHVDNSAARFTDPDGGWFCGAAADPKRPGVFALASNRGTIQFVEAATGRLLSKFPVTERQRRGVWLRSLDFSPDGTRLVAGGLSGAGVAVYRVEDGTCLAQWEADAADTVQFDGEGVEVLSVEGQDLKIRDAGTGELRWSYHPCLRAAFAPDHRVAITWDHTVRLLDRSTHAVVREFPRLREDIAAIVIDPASRTLFLATLDGAVQGLGLDDGGIRFFEHLTSRGAWPRLALGPQGRSLVAASGAADGFRALRAWDIRTGLPLKSFLGPDANIEGLAFHPLSDDVVVTGVDTRSWSLANRAPGWSLHGTAEAGVFLGNDDLFLPSQVPVRLLPEGHTGPLPWSWPPPARDAAAADAAGDCIVTGRSQESTAGKSSLAVLHRRRDGVKVTSTFDSPLILHLLRLDPTGQRLALCDFYSGVEVRSTSGGPPLPVCDTNGFRNFNDLAWLSPTRLVGLLSVGERGAVNWQERIVLWDTETGRQLANVRFSSFMNRLAVSPDGRTIAEAGGDQRIRLRDPVTLEQTHEFRAHDGPITALAFHPTRRVLASASVDLTVRLWNLEDHDSLLEEIRVPGKEIQSLRFSPSGQLLAGADSRDAACIWDLRAPSAEAALPAPSPAEEAARERDRGGTFARAQHWAEARAALANAVRLEPSTEGPWYSLAPLLVQLGDTAAYRRLCHDLLGRFGTSADPVTMERVAKACLIGQPSEADLAQAARLGRSAATNGAQHPFVLWFRLARGLGEYRTGDFAAAVPTLRGIVQQPAKGNLDVLAGAALAMALQRSGQPQAAQAALATAREAAAAVLPADSAPDWGEAWHDHLTARLLLREAAETVEHP